MVFKVVSSIHDNSCFDKMCIWHYTASWCEQCLNYCIEMLSKRKKLPRLNPRESSRPLINYEKTERRLLQSGSMQVFWKNKQTQQTKVNKLHALSQLLRTWICLLLKGINTRLKIISPFSIATLPQHSGWVFF